LLRLLGSETPGWHCPSRVLLLRNHSERIKRVHAGHRGLVGVHGHAHSSHTHHGLETLRLLLLHHRLEAAGARVSIEGVAVATTVGLVHHQSSEGALAGQVLSLVLVLLGILRLLLHGCCLAVLLRVEAVQHGVLVLRRDFVRLWGQGLAALSEDVRQGVHPACHLLIC
jgi:hypothetical protein